MTPDIANFKPRLSVLSGRGAFLALFLTLVAAAWVLLFVWNMDHSRAAPSFDTQSIYFILSPSYLASLCRSPMSEAGIETTVAMWGLMSVGMMLPTASPIIGAYFTLASGQPLRISSRNIWGLIGGYVTVWLVFSVGAGFMQWGLARHDLLSAYGMSASAPLSVTLLLVAGVYQFSTIKAACLSRCRSPLAFFMSEWRDRLAGAFRMGLRHGLDCLGCCWVLMLLAFVGGTMNLIWMGLATALMTLEKLPSIGRLLTKPVGALLILCAAYLAWVNFTAV
jgi:predicted metal-binding membrane protein